MDWEEEEEEEKSPFHTISAVTLAELAEREEGGRGVPYYCNSAAPSPWLLVAERGMEKGDGGGELTEGGADAAISAAVAATASPDRRKHSLSPCLD